MASSDTPSSALTLEDNMHAITDIRKDLHAIKARVTELSAAKPDEPAGPHRQPFTGWRPPPSRTTASSADPVPRMRIDAPRFNGDDPTGWIFRIQKYFDYFLTPEPERLQLVAMLIDHSASDWFHYYQSNTHGASWADFLTAFESLLDKVSGVPEATLISMFVADLKQPVQRELNLGNPTTLQSAFALARELSACHQEAAVTFGTSPCHPWPNRPPPSSAGILPTPPPHTRTAPERTKPPDRPFPGNLPVVTVSLAKKAERSKKGLCWWCEEKWDRIHNCRRCFLALMGPDNEEEMSPTSEPTPDLPDPTAVITGDVSSIHSMSGSPNPRSLKLAGSVNGKAVQVVLDSGSTHNFIHPGVVERLSLVLHPVSPFRVYVGVLKPDPEKIAAMVAWPKPTSVTQLRAFLGLTGYYRRFISGYAVLASPLTDLLKKNNFLWDANADTSFAALKTAMTTTLVLRLPDFNQVFYLETDASNSGVSAVLLQHGHPLAFFSKKLGPRRRLASTYHKELYAIVEAVQKWRHYLLGREFVIRSDQRSLKEILHQVVQTPDQQFYIRKLMGYKFRIEYKTGAANRTADALSCRDEDAELTTLFTTYSRPLTNLLDALAIRNSQDSDLQQLHAAVTAGSAKADFSMHNGLLYYHHRLVLSSVSPLRHQLLAEYHSSPMAGHQGVERTFHRLATTFYWPGMRKDVRQFVAACLDCQTTKYSTRKPAGLLQPLPTPDQVWESASMDFITGLPPSRGASTILVVVDRLTKYSHFGSLPADFDAPRVA
ncbi:unnamed protein product [Cuscuta campestris]|uniref:Integrase zinc-binding domain-containing protein n=1 Tax=Cuscuta campestris TaxID=132261 RepID=A0A484NIA0_9ASTE|nr:unnamed protein product [Cuscuta campestris]